jgi:hypothetical protein
VNDPPPIRIRLPQNISDALRRPVASGQDVPLAIRLVRVLDREHSKARDIPDVDEAGEAAYAGLVKGLAAEDIPDELDALVDLGWVGVRD